MRVAILNGDRSGAAGRFGQYLTRISDLLRAARHEAVVHDLAAMELLPCTGCLDCLWTTPGECPRPDGFPALARSVINADFVLLASPLRMGFPSAELKTAIERLVEVSQDIYGEVAQGEVHHRRRYARYPVLGLLLEHEADTDAGDVAIVSDVFSRIALAVHSRLAFVASADEPPAAIAARVADDRGAAVPFDPRPAAVPGVRITPPRRLTVFNGSPRGRRSNTMMLLEPFLTGFASNAGGDYEIVDLIRLRRADQFPQVFAEAECAVLGFPLYADSMPGIVMAFLEGVAPLRAADANPPLAFLVQGGFPEATHARHVERYLARLARRLGSPYLGTIVKGGCEMLREEDALHRRLYDALFWSWGMFGTLEELGRRFGETGGLDAGLLHRLARLERYPRFMLPMLRLGAGLPPVNHYWDVRLRRTGAVGRRRAQPYIET